MNSNIELVEKYIPPDNPGYQFVKRTVSYIPVKEVGLSILVRKNQTISFIYETVLKFLQIGINDISRLCDTLGLDLDVFKEIISKMAVEDLIYVSENQAGLTKKGEEALKSLTKVTIEKTQLNRIFVNLVTGELCLQEPTGLRNRPLPSSMYLDGVVDVDTGYFFDHFEHINAIYESSLISNVLEFGGPSDLCELYRILDIAYQETRFLPVSCFIYVKPSKHEIFLSFDSDKDSIFMSTALAQIKEQSNGMEKLLDNPMPLSEPEDNPTMRQGLKDFLSILQLRKKSKVSVQEIEEAYYTDRYLLDGEIRDILIECEEFKPIAICISTPFLCRLLEDDAMIYNITTSKAKDIFIEYDANEYKVEDFLKRFQKKISDSKIIHLHKINNPTQITEDTFIIYPHLLIKTKYQNIEIGLPKKVLLKPNSTITFNKSSIDEVYNYFKEIVNPTSDET